MYSQNLIGHNEFEMEDKKELEPTFEKMTIICEEEEEKKELYFSPMEEIEPPNLKSAFQKMTIAHLRINVTTFFNTPLTKENAHCYKCCNAFHDMKPGTIPVPIALGRCEISHRFKIDVVIGCSFECVQRYIAPMHITNPTIFTLNSLMRLKIYGITKKIIAAKGPKVYSILFIVGR